MSFFELLPILLQLVGWFIGKRKNSEEARRRFVELVESLEYGGMRSVSLNDSYREQIEERKRARSMGEFQSPRVEK